MEEIDCSAPEVVKSGWSKPFQGTTSIDRRQRKECIFKNWASSSYLIGAREMRGKLKLIIDGRGGSIAVESFLGIVQSSHSLLRDFSSSKEKWNIGNVRRENPLHFEFIGDHDGSSETIACIFDGLGKLKRGKALPDYYDDNARKHLSSISKRLANGIASISFAWGEKKTVTFNSAFYSYESEAGLVEPYTVLAEIEGTFETLDTHAGHSEFYVYDRISGRGTQCRFSDIPIPELRGHFGHRIRVFGKVKYDKHNFPKTMDVLSFRPITNKKSLEEVREAGFSLDSNLSASEIIKAVRSLDA